MAFMTQYKFQFSIQSNEGKSTVSRYLIWTDKKISDQWGICSYSYNMTLKREESMGTKSDLRPVQGAEIPFIMRYLAHKSPVQW